MRLLACLVLLGACDPGPVEIEVTPTQYNAMRQVQTALLPGDDLDLVRPPQGGFVLFIGVRVRGLEEATVELESQLLDGGVVATSDRRTVRLIPMAEDVRLYQPDLTVFTNVNHVPMCPSQSAVDRFDRPFRLRQTVREPGSGRVGAAELEVTPRCRQSDATELARCRCECERDYRLGKC
jgi:hypothetical protein